VRSHLHSVLTVLAERCAHRAAATQALLPPAPRGEGRDGGP
jgi:hypothetical protein